MIDQIRGLTRKLADLAPVIDHSAPDSAPESAATPWAVGSEALAAALVYYAAVFFAVSLVSDVGLPARSLGYVVSSIACLFAAGGVVLVLSSMNWEPDVVSNRNLVIALAALAGADLLFLALGNLFLSSLAVLVGAALVGVVLDRFAFIDRDVVLLLCVLYIIVDVYSVFFGPTGAVVQRGGVLLDALTVHFPIVGVGRLGAVIGGTDFAVWTALLLAARRFGFDFSLSFVAMGLSLVITSLIGIGLHRAVPALPLMMLAYLWVNRRHFGFRNRQLWLLGGAALVIVLIIGTVMRWVLTR